MEQPHRTWVIFAIDGVGYSPDCYDNCYNYLEISFYAQAFIQELPNKPFVTYPPGFIGLNWYQSLPSDRPETIDLLDFPNTIPEGFKAVEGIEFIGIQLSSSIKDDEVWVVVDFVDTWVGFIYHLGQSTPLQQHQTSHDQLDSSTLHSK